VTKPAFTTAGVEPGCNLRKHCLTFCDALHEHHIREDDPAFLLPIRHSRIAITMEIYTQVPAEETRKALRQLGDALGEVG
jgi:hypothetical protein